VTSEKEKLQKALKAIDEGEKEVALKLLTQVADSFSEKEEYKKAANLYEKSAFLARDLYRADDAFGLMESAIVMLLRLGSSEVHPEIARMNIAVGKIAEEATEFKIAAEFYSRAADFVTDDNKRNELMTKAGDALENLADVSEHEKDYPKAVSLLKKVGRIYYSVGDDELGERIYVRATRVALTWGEVAKIRKDFLSAGNAFAEAAQLKQMLGESVEAIRTMMDAGDLYDQIDLHEKAGNIYDAAAEAYKMQRLTSARKLAMTKAAESYLKMEGKPEVISPLLVKAGDIFTEINRPMKAKWAFKKASDLFAELAQKAVSERDIDSEKSYLRHQAMCLAKWGHKEESEAIYKNVTEYFLDQAKTEEDRSNKESQAIFLESAAETLYEADDTAEAQKHMERALEICIELADSYSTSGNNDEGSKFYSKAAACAGKLGDFDRQSSFHWIASDKAEEAAAVYKEMDLAELETIWIRTAGTEALNTMDPKMIEKAIDLLQKSAIGFKAAHEEREAFDDLFTVTEIIMKHDPSAVDKLAEIIKEMELIISFTQEDSMIAAMPIIKALGNGNHLSALMLLQEREEDLPKKRERLKTLIDIISK